MSVATELLSLLTTAAGSMTAPALTQIGGGEPDVVNLPTLAYWYVGQRTWEANTFSYTQERECWHIRGYLPVGSRFVAGNVDVEGWIVTLVGAIRGQLYGKVGLNGAATGEGITLSDATPGWAQVGNQLCRVVDMDLDAYLSNVHSIAV